MSSVSLSEPRMLSILTQSLGTGPMHRTSKIWFGLVKFSLIPLYTVLHGKTPVLFVQTCAWKSYRFRRVTFTFHWSI